MQGLSVYEIVDSAYSGLCTSFAAVWEKVKQRLMQNKSSFATFLCSHVAGVDLLEIL